MNTIPEPPRENALPTPYDLRARLERTVLADLLGPANGPEEMVEERYVRDRYLVGRLGPQGQSLLADDEAGPSVDDLEGELAVAGVDDEDGATEERMAYAPSMQPASLGLSFVVDGQARALHLTARWGRYVRESGSVDPARTQEGKPRQIWRRVPVEGIKEALPLRPGRTPSWAPNPDQPAVRVEGLVRRRQEQWHVTLFLVNGQREPKQNKDAAWLFQPELTVADADGGAIFQRRFAATDHDDPEVRAMAMRYRRTLEFAIGHGVSVQADLDPADRTRAVRLTTQVVPAYEVPRTEVFVPPGLVLDMRRLAATADGDFGAALLPLVTAYEAWIADLAAQRNGTEADLAAYTQEAQATLHHCRRTADRIRAGISLLDRDPQAAQAFRFANQAMADQRVHALYAAQSRQEQPADLAALEAKASNHSWRTFQLGFLLLNLPGLTDLTHPERGELADLLWFPTGGGKTEAYLGVAAYALAIRRLQGVVGGRSGHAGVTVLMRYTLRLLTLQQFQRAAALICACEVIRRTDPATWGSEPFRLGLWVGANSTPNWTEDAEEAIKQIRNRNYYSGGTPHQLTNCPWCGAAIKPGEHILVEPAKRGRGRTFVYCGDDYGRCAFSRLQAPDEGLPILTVDEEIYRRLPALLIATVDKFAQLPWNGRTAMLFGQVDGYCERHGFRSPEVEDSDSHPARGALPKARTIPLGPLRPPDLIIQDELHLISGPLGTMVGLYESAVDRLCTWQVAGQTVQPKIIASTATVRHAAQQVQQLFLRQVNVFPAQGLDAEDNFFAYQLAPATAENPGRRYIGIYAPGVRFKAALIRVYTAFLSAAQHLYGVDSYGRAADPWMTLVGYFNSLRELGGMKRAVDDSVSTRLRRMERGHHAGRAPGLASRLLSIYDVAELTSRLSATEIPAILDHLEMVFDPVAEAARRRLPDGNSGKTPIDVLLATNLISVGVDVARLGLMVVAGQPKNTAEYIQATSRVGRQFPGLVCTVYNWTRPRDISHYERFAHYHATFYQQVEALSLTPFAPRALDRGISAALVAQVRNLDLTLNANAAAAGVTATHPAVQAALTQLVERAAALGGEPSATLVQTMLAERLRYWAARIQAATHGAQLGYRPEKNGYTVGLLRDPDGRGWTPFTCLNSLRNVETTVNLILDEHRMDQEDERPWQSPRPQSMTTEEQN